MSEKPKETYNGWANFETWIVRLWMSNDRDAYVHWRSRTEEVLRESKTKEPVGGALGQLADQVRDAIEGQCTIPKANLAADLMNAALSRVDWHEVAEALIDDANEGNVGRGKNGEK